MSAAVLRSRDGPGLTHRIEDLVFDFAIAPAVWDRSDPDTLAWAVRTELVPLIEEVLDACGANLRIDELTIDVGAHPVLDWPTLRSELRQRLQLALAGRAVEGQLGVSGISRPAGAGIGAKTAGSDGAPEPGDPTQAERPAQWLSGTRGDAPVNVQAPGKGEKARDETLALSGAALLRYWRRDPLAFGEALDGQDADALGRLWVAVKEAVGTTASMDQDVQGATTDARLRVVEALGRAILAAPQDGEAVGRTAREARLPGPGQGEGGRQGPTPQVLEALSAAWRDDQSGLDRFLRNAPENLRRALVAAASSAQVELPGPLTPEPDLLQVAASAAPLSDPPDAFRDLPGADDLLSLWRVDRAAFKADLERSDAPALLDLIGRILKPGPDSPSNPLLDAVQGLAQAGPGAAKMLRAVLEQIVADAPIDLDRIASDLRETEHRDATRTTDPDAPREPAAEAPSTDAGPGDRSALGAGTDAAGLEKIPSRFERDVLSRPIGEALAFASEFDRASFGSLLDAAGSADKAGAAAVIAAVLLRPGLLSEILTEPNAGPGRTDRLIRLLGPEDRDRLLAGLRPGLASRDRAVIGMLWAALPERVMAPPLSETTRWQFTLCAADGGIARWGGVAGLVARVVNWLAPDAQRRSVLAGILVDVFHKTPPAGPEAARVQILGALRSMAPATPAVAAPAARNGQDVQPETTAEPVLTQAAGLVLLTPWLPMLFNRLDLSEGLIKHEPASAERAMDVLWAVLNGEASPGEPRPRPLERLLCAVPQGVVLRPPMPVDTDTAEMVESLLGAVLSQWTALGQTSVSGLREAFLRREGLLRQASEGSALSVAPKAYDMLLDQLPWSFRLVKFRWMDQPLHVNWRNGNE